MHLTTCLYRLATQQRRSDLVAMAFVIFDETYQTLGTESLEASWNDASVEAAY